MPPVTPDTTPVDEPTLATAVLDDDQVPPETVADSVVVEPEHTEEDPLMEFETHPELYN